MKFRAKQIPQKKMISKIEDIAKETIQSKMYRENRRKIKKQKPSAYPRAVGQHKTIQYP